MRTFTARRDESGVTMVIIGVSLVSLILVVGLVLDGGAAYAARRQVRNATDAAALTGAQALFTAVATGSAADKAAIAPAVNAKLNQNGVTGGQSCFYATATGASLGVACGSDIPPTASGVVVGGSITLATKFIRVGGQKTVTANGMSTAGILPLVGTSSPFIVCGEPNGTWPILNPIVAGQPATINVQNAVAAGTQPLQAARVGTCGAGDSFKGKTSTSEGQIITGDYAQGQVGNGFESDIRDQVVGAGLTPCPIPFPADFASQCDMMLPIADTGYGNGSGQIFLHVAAWGIFHVTGNGSGNPKYYGQFVAPSSGVATGGVAASGTQCTIGSQLCVIKILG